MRFKKFKIGDHVRNKFTGQEGHIVRIADTSPGVAYIVFVVLGKQWGGINKEALWRREVVVNATKAATVGS